MKFFAVTICVLALSFLLVPLATAQNVMDVHGLELTFVEGTTMEQLFAMEARYPNLMLLVNAHFDAGGWTLQNKLGNRTIQEFRDRHALQRSKVFARIMKGEDVPAEEQKGCWSTHTCPPVLVAYAHYEPVDPATATALASEPIVAAVQNRFDLGFFFIRKMELWLDARMNP